MKKKYIIIIVIIFFLFCVSFLICDEVNKNIYKTLLINPKLTTYMYNRLILADAYIEKSSSIKHLFVMLILTLFLSLHSIIHLLMLVIYSPRQYITLLRKPFMSPIFGSTIYTLVPFYDKYSYGKKYRSKLFWNDIFVRNGVNTPRVFAYSMDGELKGKVPKNIDVLWKPVYGVGGFKIKEKLKPPKRGFYLCQEKIKSDKEYTYVMRINTYRKNTKIYFLDYDLSYNKNGETVVNPYKFSSKLYLSKNGNMKEYDTVNRYIDSIEKDCIKLHKKVDYPIIGWDVIFDRNTYYFLEGNTSPGMCTGKTYFKCIKKYTKIAGIK